MSYQVTLEVPDAVYRQAELFATRQARSTAEVLTEWLAATSSDDISATSCDAMKSLADGLVLELSKMQPTTAQETEMTSLLERQREGQLSADDRARLDELANVYHGGLLLKSAALVEAVRRGLRPPLS